MEILEEQQANGRPGITHDAYLAAVRQAERELSGTTAEPRPWNATGAGS